MQSADTNNHSITQCHLQDEYTISFSNKPIWQFYKDNPKFNIITTNALIITILQQTFNNISQDVNTNINSQLLQYMTNNKKQIDTIADEIQTIKTNNTQQTQETINKILSQLTTNKNTYMDDVKILLQNNALTSTEKINTIIDKNNTHLIDKTALIIKDSIPKAQEQLIQQLNLNFSKLNTIITEDAKRIATNKDTSIKEFMATIEAKYTNMLQTIQQPLLTYFTASEERLTKTITTISETTQKTNTTQEPVMNALEEFLSKHNMSNHKGKHGEAHLTTILNTMYPSAEIKLTAAQKASGDLILTRNNKPTILFENKDYKFNVDKDEITKFIRDIDSVGNMSGILMSHFSGIAFKENYHIDIHRGQVLVYIQQCQYNPDKIRVAIEIIDHLHNKIQQLNAENDEGTQIPQDTLDDINAEYQTFLNQKDNLQTILKDFVKRMTTQIDEIKLPTLDKLLEPKYAQLKQRNYICPFCEKYEAYSKQSLAAHQRGCKKKVIPNTIQPSSSATIPTITNTIPSIQTHPQIQLNIQPQPIPTHQPPSTSTSKTTIAASNLYKKQQLVQKQQQQQPH